MKFLTSGYESFETPYSRALEVVSRFLDPVSIEDLTIGTDSTCDIPISTEFLRKISEQKFSHKEHFFDQPIIMNNGNADYLSSIVYMLNYTQEIDSDDLDNLGRFKFEHSYQSKFSVVSEDLVKRYSLELIEATPKLKAHRKTAPMRSKVFLSHDNDVFYGSLRYDGFAALKQGRIDWLVQIVFRELFKNPYWFNMDQIMKIEDEYDVKSTFFWLINQGPVKVEGIEKPLRNADYDFGSTSVQACFSRIENSQWENGLHKSISSESFKEENQKLGKQAIANRNHYLKLNYPGHFEELDEGGIKVDSSMGFAEMPGWRNSFSQPYCPVDMRSNKPFDCIEVPLAIMDTTYWTYLKYPPSNVRSSILDLLESYSNDALFGILWHNKYFTKYKFRGYLEVYKAILSWMKENEVKSIQPDEIVAAREKDNFQSW